MKKRILISLLTLVLSFYIIPVYAYSHGNNSDCMSGITVMQKNPGAAHEKYKVLYEAIIKLKAKGIYTDDNIKAIHNFYQQAVKTNPDSVPTCEKDLLDLLYKSNVISKTQYEQTKDIMKK